MAAPGWDDVDDDDETVPPLVGVEGAGGAEAADATAAAAPAAEAPPEPPLPVRLGHVAGLENLGNTCFFNSVLQNLCGLDALAAHFSSSPLEEAAPLTTGLRTLLRAYAKAAPAATVKPSHLHGAVVKRAPRFKGYGQQDAQELLMTLLDGLQWEEVVAARAAAAAAAAEAAAAAAPPAAGADGDDAATCNGGASAVSNGDAAPAPPAAAAPPAPPLQVRTFVDDFFGGMLASTIVCGTCHTASTTLEPFMDVSLPIPAPAAPPSPARGFNSRFAFAADGPKRPANPFAAKAAAAAEARAAASKKDKETHAFGATAAVSASTSAASSRGHMSHKQRKKALKEERRNAKRTRVPRGGKAAAAVDGAGPPAPDSPRSATSSTTSGSGSAAASGDDDDELSDASSPAPPPGAAAPETDSDGEETQQPAPAVITLGPPASSDGNWLEMLDDAPAAAEEAAKLMRDEGNAADCEGDALEASGAVRVLGPLSALPPLRGLPPLGELVPMAAVEAPPAAAAAPSDGPASVRSCLEAFVADEPLTGACRYACEACARAAAASAAARRASAKSVRWAPEEALESVRLIPANVNPGDYPSSGEEESDTAGADDALLPLDGVSDDESEAQGAAGRGMCDLSARFAEAAAVEEGGGDTDDTLAGVAASLSAMALSRGADEDDDDEDVVVPELLAPSPPPPLIDVLDAADALDALPVSSPPPGAEGDAAAVTPEPAAPPPVLRDAAKRLRFAHLPRCLVVHLKRFRQDARGRTSKISGHVVFEEELDLAPFWSPPPPPADGGEAAAAPPPPSAYRLQGVVEHSGGLHGGHYVAFVRRGRGRDWHYASDRTVRPATLAQALSAEAYLLFYTRDDCDLSSGSDATPQAQEM